MKALTKKLAPTPSNRFQALATCDDPWQNGDRKFCETCRTPGHTEEEHAAIPDPDAETTIQSLPAELRLDILSMLSPTEIQRFRGVSKDSQELVDAPDNKPALFPTREKFEQQYLADSNYFLGSPEEPSLLRFLFTFLSRRGLWKDNRHTRLLIQTAVLQWSANWSRKAKKMVQISQGSSAIHFCSYLTKIGECLVQAFIDEHCPELTASIHDGWARKMRDVYNHHVFIAHIDTPENFVGLQYLISELGLPLSREQMFQWYMDIKAHREPSLPTYPPSVIDKSDGNGLLRIPLSGDPCLEKPEFPITSVIYWDQTPESFKYRSDEWLTHVGGRCSTWKLSQILGENLPKLICGVGICVKTKWAYDLITKAKHNKRRPLTDWQRAAILEQLYLW